MKGLDRRIWGKRPAYNIIKNTLNKKFKTILEKSNINSYNWDFN